MSSMSSGVVGTRGGGMGKGHFHSGIDGVGTERRLWKVRGVRAGISKIDTGGAATGISLAQDVERGRNSSNPIQRCGTKTSKWKRGCVPGDWGGQCGRRPRVPRPACCRVTQTWRGGGGADPRTHAVCARRRCARRGRVVHHGE